MFNQSFVTKIRQTFSNRDLLKQPETQQAIHETIDALDQGKIRVAEKIAGHWQINDWVREAILLYFALRPNQPMELGALSFFDKIPLKHDYQARSVRAVPPGVARYGSFLAPGCVLMPGYVNIGAYVDEGTMIDTFATVGSCAQIGKHVHLSGGVGIGGVLEPVGARPVIIEDGAFIGSRSIIVEGVLVEEEAVLAAGVILTGSTPIVDITGTEPKISKGCIPARSVVIPGTMPKTFAAGTYQVSCALIIGQRTASTDRKTSLNDVLRTYQISG